MSSPQASRFGWLSHMRQGDYRVHAGPQQTFLGRSRLAVSTYYDNIVRSGCLRMHLFRSSSLIVSKNDGHCFRQIGIISPVLNLAAGNRINRTDRRLAYDRAFICCRVVCMTFAADQICAEMLTLVLNSGYLSTPPVAPSRLDMHCPHTPRYNGQERITMMQGNEPWLFLCGCCAERFCSDVLSEIYLPHYVECLASMLLVLSCSSCKFCEVVMDNAKQDW